MSMLRNKQKKRRRRDDTGPLMLLVLAQYWMSAFAEDAAASSSSSSASQNNNGESSQITYGKNQGRLHVQRYCRRKSVVVTSVRLTCDSSGAYYYGSKTYRGSEVCIDGDKANLKVHLTISDDFDSSSSIYLIVEAGMYNNYRLVVGPANLCQLQIQPTEGSSQACPRRGDYVLQSQFYVPRIIQDNSDFHFTPDLNLTFTDGNYNRLGCAVTGTTALHLEAERRHTIGMMALAFGLMIFGVVMGGLLLLAYRRRKRLETLTERKTPRYQYFRTLPNGQVVPIQHGHPAVPPPQHMHPPPPAPYHMSPGAPQEAFQISNPAYNETQLPTRPVI